MNRSSLLSRLFLTSPRWRRIAVWAALLSTSAGASAFAQAPPEQVFSETPQESFVLPPDASGALAARPAHSDVGVGGMGVFGRVGHIAGETVGRTQSITHFELMPYIFEGETMFYGDGRLYSTNNGHMGGTAGLGVRHYLPNWNSIVGGGIFYDKDDSRGEAFEQISLGLEYLSEWLDVRTNLYQSIGRDSAELGTSFVRGSERFEGYRILFDTVTKTSAATDGIDMLFTVPVAAEWAQAVNLEASAGWYHYQARGFDLDKIWGYKLRLDADWFSNFLHTFTEFTSDRVFENCVVFGADVNYYHDVERRPRIGHNQFNRMAEWVRRNYTVVTIDQNVLNAPSYAINPETNQPYIVVHARNIQPPDPDFPNFPAGDGQPDTPFQFIDDAKDFLVDDGISPAALPDIVFVHAGSVYDTPIDIDRDNLQILGEGVIHPIAVTNAPFSRARPFDPLGTIPLPTVTTNTQVPILQNAAGTAVTFSANNGTFAGFDIIDPAGTGIRADGVSGLTIRDVDLSGASSHGIHLSDVSGNVRIENTTIADTAGDSFFVDGGNATLNWFGGTITSTANHSVLIQNQTGGLINLAGDNATNPANGFGGVTISDTGGQGILIQNTNASVSFGRSAQSAPGAGVTVRNSTSAGVRILNYGNPGTISFLRGLVIDNAAEESLDLANTTGSFVLADDETLLTDLVISNRQNAGIDLTNIDAPGSVVFFGDVDLGSVVAGGTTAAAINFQNNSTGLVRFEGDLAIGDPDGVDFASINDTINIGGASPNADGARFQANGNITIGSTQNGASIHVSNDPTDVQFGLPLAPGAITINPVDGPAILLTNNTGTIAFNSSTTIGNSVNSTVVIDENLGQISFGSLTVNNSAGADPAVVVTDNRNGGAGNVAFASLNINNTGGLAFLGTENDRLSIGTGTITSVNGAAIDLVNNDFLNATFASVSATNYAPGPFGIRVIDDRFEPNPNASFRILGTSTTRGSGGLISSGVVLDDGIQSRGTILQNIQTAFINLQDYSQNDGMAIDALNVRNFTLQGGTFSDNGRDELEGARHHVRVVADVAVAEPAEYIWRISDANTFTDTTPIVTNDAMVYLLATANAVGSQLDLTMTDNQIVDDDDNPTTPGFVANRGLTNAAAVRVDWRGDLNALFQNNWIDIEGDFTGTTGLDIIQRGTSFANDIEYSIGNQIRGNSEASFDLTGLRMQLDGVTTLDIVGNWVGNDPANPTAGFVFNGESATAIDLTLRTAGNNILIDDNVIEMLGGGGTGILFTQLNASNVTIGDLGVGDLDFGNGILLSDLDGTERGIVFQTTFGTINLFGDDDNLIILDPDAGGAFIDFQPPATSTGTILINGAPRP